ncbi:hypothetical protein [Micromonospora sp. HM5-17]|uniref:hypothetical protein n=1 Tax=Micromonospora sp. HM5-17 TaxID=2487710 RepID=UPI0011CDEFA5|nr:hypothetical protein [Micromonospora sp. HM5-17]
MGVWSWWRRRRTGELLRRHAVEVFAAAGLDDAMDAGLAIARAWRRAAYIGGIVTVVGWMKPAGMDRLGATGCRC